MRHGWSKRIAMWMIGVGSAWLVTSCRADVGKCDMTLLGGDATTGVAHPAQTVMNASCAGSRCHSETATAANRVGAPAGLNFDVGGAATADQVTRSGKNVKDNLDDIWDQINSGDMPPKGKGAALAAQDKETLRNWLACGAPAIAPQGTQPVAADWTSIFATLSGACAPCHATMNAPASACVATGASQMTPGFALGDAADPCGAYHNVVGKAASTCMCKSSGAMLVVPNQPDSSLLLQKLEGKQSCGMPMPLGGTGLITTMPAVVQALRQWIANGAPAPTGCI